MNCKKSKRIEDIRLLETYHDMECAACGDWQNVSGHHIKSRGAGGHDIPENLIPLCIRCHTEIHMIGPTKFYQKYPKLRIGSLLKA